MSAVNADESIPGLKEKIGYCAVCHGLTGGGFQGYYAIPRLAGQTQEYLENQLRYYTDHTRDNPSSKQFMWSAVDKLSLPMKTALADYFSKLDTPPSGGGKNDYKALGNR